MQTCFKQQREKPDENGLEYHYRLHLLHHVPLNGSLVAPLAPFSHGGCVLFLFIFLFFFFKAPNDDNNEQSARKTPASDSIQTSAKLRDPAVPPAADWLAQGAERVDPRRGTGKTKIK